MKTTTTIRVRISVDGEVRYDQRIWFNGTEDEIKTAAVGFLHGVETLFKNYHSKWSTLYINGEVYSDGAF